MMLWPISMLSRIFEIPSIAVPASQAGGKMPANSSARPPTSSARCVLMTRRMWSASRWPRSAITRSLMASSSAPNASACSEVRLILGCDMIGASKSLAGLQRDVDIADGNGHADLHVLAGCCRHRTGGQIAHYTAGLAACAGVADAHPASAVRVQPGRFGLLQQWAAIIYDVNAAVRERDPPTRWLRRQVERRRHEALRVHVLALLTDRLDQSCWTTDEDRVGFRHGRGQVAVAKPAVEVAAGRSGVAVQHSHTGHRGKLVAVARLGTVARAVHKGNLARVALVDQRAQHCHDGRDPAAARDEQNAAGSLRRQHEVAADTGQTDDHPATRTLVQIGRDQSAVVMSDGQLK